MKTMLKLGAMGLLLAACSSGAERVGETTAEVQARDTPAIESCLDVSSITGTYTVSYTPMGDAGARNPEGVAYVGGERRDQGSPCQVTVTNCTVTEEWGCVAAPRLTTSGWVVADDAGVFDRDGPATVITGAITFPDGQAYTFRGSLNGM